METVLITGAAGMVGQVLMGRLAGDYDMRGLDIQPAEGVAEVSVADYEALLPTMDGVDVVVHLAAVTSPSSPWEDVLEHNIVGTCNVFEAARARGVGRVVYTSSHQALRLYEDEEPYVSVLAGASGGMDSRH